MAVTAGMSAPAGRRIASMTSLVRAWPVPSQSAGLRAWRILIGEDARKLDGHVRTNPEGAYDYAELARMAKVPATRTSDRQCQWGRP